MKTKDTGRKAEKAQQSIGGSVTCSLMQRDPDKVQTNQKKHRLQKCVMIKKSDLLTKDNKLQSLG